jgi:tol-pal system protein YbgF
MTQRRGVLLTVLILLAVSVIPIDAANKEHQQMMADLRILQQQTQILQAQLAALAEALKTVTARIDEQAGVNRKAFADSRLQLDAATGDLRVVREKVDETNVRISSLSQEVEALRQAQAAAAAQQPVAAPAAAPADPSAQPQPPAATAPTPTPPAGQAAGSLSPGTSPQKLFESARADYYVGQWSLAIQGFETYLKTFPKSDLTDDAQYYIGETHYASGKFREAVEAYDRLIAAWPASNTLPDAYYKRGLALNALGQVPQARESFEFVVKTYPDSVAGQLARQQLDRLNSPRK